MNLNFKIMITSTIFFFVLNIGFGHIFTLLDAENGLYINVYKYSSIQHDSWENVNKLHFMNNFPIYINLSLYSVFYDIIYFYISTYNIMMASNNSDTARYTYRNISPVSLKMAVLMSSSEMKVRLRYFYLFASV